MATSLARGGGEGGGEGGGLGNSPPAMYQVVSVGKAPVGKIMHGWCCVVVHVDIHYTHIYIYIYIYI